MQIDAREAQTGGDWPARVAAALAAGRVALALQPVVMARDTGRVAFREALVRLLATDGQAIPAGAFIAAVERTEAGRALDRAVLALALEHLAADPGLRLAINLSPLGIDDPGWAACLAGALDRDATLAERLIVEITEGAVGAAPEALGRFVTRWQATGVAFALDDFGAGATAFRHLRDIRFDIVKIDARFSRDVHRDPDNQALMRAMVGLGRHFEALVVAEGVESQAEAGFLAARGLDALQGYHFGAPALAAPAGPTAAARRA